MWKKISTAFTFIPDGGHLAFILILFFIKRNKKRHIVPIHTSILNSHFLFASSSNLQMVIRCIILQNSYVNNKVNIGLGRTDNFVNNISYYVPIFISSCETFIRFQYVYYFFQLPDIFFNIWKINLKYTYLPIQKVANAILH